MSVTNPTTDDYIRWIVGGSLDAGKQQIKTLLSRPDEREPKLNLKEIFEAALTREVRGGQNRRSLKDALHRAIKQVQPQQLVTCPGCQTPGFDERGLKRHKCKGENRLLPAVKPAQGKLSLQGESTGPDWDRARFLLSRIKTAVRLSIAGQVLLGMELLTLKTELGFLGSGRRKENPQDAVFKSLNRTWEDWCKSELGISADTGDRKIEIYLAAKARVKKLGGDTKLAGLLETHPAKLTEEDEKILGDMVNKLVDGDSQKSLLEELKIVKCHVPITGGDTSQHQKPKPGNAEQLVFAMFAPVEETITKAARAVENLRLGPDYQRLLYALPIVSSEPGKPSLTALEAQLSAALEGDIATALKEIRQVKELRMQNPEAKPS